MKNLEVLYLTSRSREKCQQKQKQNHLQKTEKLKQSIKLNKNILIAKTLEAFTPKAKFDLFNYTYLFQKYIQNQFLVAEIGPVLYLQ